MKKFLKIFLTIIISLCLIIFANHLISKMPQHIKNPEELVELHGEFKKIPMESCDCYWQADIIAFGGVKECHASGKITVSEDYYSELIERYEWSECSGLPYSDSGRWYNIDRACKSFKEFAQEKYLVSDEFQADFNSLILLSAEKNELYFYWYKI